LKFDLNDKGFGSLIKDKAEFSRNYQNGFFSSYFKELIKGHSFYDFLVGYDY